MKRGTGSKKHNNPRSQAQTPPRKRKAVSSVTWGASPTRLTLLETGTSGRNEGGDLLSLIVDQDPDTIVADAPHSVPLDADMQDLDIDQDSSPAPVRQTSIFEKWDTVTIGIDDPTTAVPKGLTKRPEDSVSSSGDELLSALSKLASGIREIVDCPTQMSQIGPMKESPGRELPQAPPSLAHVATVLPVDAIHPQGLVSNVTLDTLGLEATRSKLIGQGSISVERPPAPLLSPQPIVFMPGPEDQENRSMSSQNSQIGGTKEPSMNMECGLRPSYQETIQVQDSRTEVQALEDAAALDEIALIEMNYLANKRSALKAELDDITNMGISDADMFLAAACSLVESNMLQAKTVGKLPLQSASCSASGKHFARFKVISVEERPEHNTSSDWIKCLRVTSKSQQMKEYGVELRGRWVETPVCVNDTINVVWTEPLPLGMETHLDGSSVIVVDDSQNFVIIRPDVLVCPTRIADANSCLRRAVLSERLAIETPSRDTVLGHMKHSMFQCALRANCFDEEFLSQVIPAVVKAPRAVEDLFRVEMCEDDAIAELSKSIKTYSRWGAIMFGSHSSGEVLEFGYGVRRRVRILRLISTEEMIWSPMWGLKGALDVTAVVGLSNVDNPVGMDENGSEEERVILPVELKTGRPGPEKTEHRAQVMLYSLLVADRYMQSTVPRNEAGVLIRAPTVGANDDFGRDLGTVSIPLITNGVRAVHQEIRELMMIRNRIAVNTTTAVPRRSGLGAHHHQHHQHLATEQIREVLADVGMMTTSAAAMMEDMDDEREKLPGITHNVTGECARCFQRDTCTLVHVAVENGDRASMNLTQEDHEKALGLLSQEHLAYFSRWNRILECEGRRNTSNQKRIWTRSPSDRERGSKTCIPFLALRILPKESESLKLFASLNDASSSSGSSQTTSSSSLSIVTDSSTVLLELFRRQEDGALLVAGGETHIAVGDLVLLSIADAHLHIAKGHVVSMQSNKIIVRAQNFPSESAIETFLVGSALDSDVADANKYRWCIDKLDILWGNRFLQGTLASMFVQVKSRSSSQSSPPSAEPNYRAFPKRSLSLSAASSSSAAASHHHRPQQNPHQQNVQKERMRSLIIDQRAPRFIDPNDPGRRFIRECARDLLQNLLIHSDSVATIRRGLVMKRVPPIPPSVPAAAVEALASQRQKRMTSLDLSGLTRDQFSAVAATLSAEDYLCIIGAPGAGKTSTIAFVVHMLHELGKSVLISSFTHSACDNLLMKIKSRGVEVLRIGLATNVRKELRESTLSEESTTVADLERHLENPRLVCGATCLGVKHPLLQRKVFDYCILDEAGQLAEPVALGPLARSRCFIFVGDPKQLPPLVVSPEARIMGMDRSLFERLVEKHPSAVVALTTQFRMNEEINALANELFYNGQLQCGSVEVAKQRLSLPYLERCFRGTETQSWLFRVVDPNAPVVFLDTDGIGTALETRRRKSSNRSEKTEGDDETAVDEEESTIVNCTEALLVHLVVDRLARSGLPLCNIGVISPYRSQLRALRSRLVDAVEVDTVDKFQGRDKECIVVSMVRSNKNNTVGSLLSDWRRLNVAFTRAKAKLVLVGSGETLSGLLAARFVQVVRNRNWVVSLLPNDIKLFPDPGERHRAGGGGV